MNQSVLIREGFNAETYLHDVPVFTIGNGMLGIRGFYEEDHAGTGGLGGIYMAGILAKGAYEPWAGLPRELVNIPNMLDVHISLNQEEIRITQETIKHAIHSLDMENSVYIRSYVYHKDGIDLAELIFTRFAGIDNPNYVGQKIEVRSLQDSLNVKIHCSINADVTNLNLVSSEPWPVQPGRKHIHVLHQDAHYTETEITEPDHIALSFYQQVETDSPIQEENTSILVADTLAKNETMTIRKMIAIACSVNDPDVKQALQHRVADLQSYAVRYEKSCQAMQKRWEDCDTVLEGSTDSQLTLHYNIYQLMQSCPEHNPNYSIGARGLTGEMYEGCVFWDTEIFMLPFFTCTKPDAARRLLHFRYKTLQEARTHAERNWFKGAMYGWQVNPSGEEQTPSGVGAYYSIHVIADIAYAILDYWLWTHDEEYILNEGLEILIETARFWASRVTKREDGQYDINAVRGPNEYDVIVNNNLYTNMMARENFVLTEKLIDQFSKSHPDRLHNLFQKLNYSREEEQVFNDIRAHLVIPYNQDKNLYLEDDTYERRKPLIMKEAKPTGKRIIDTTIPYEGLSFYQVSKQADVLHVMKNLPEYFTPEQVQTAFDYYLPKTAFDSSLSYSMFALMAARLNQIEMAVRFYEKTSNLDLCNVQLNTISGLHFANFGGTWQTIIFGFAGVSIHEDGIAFDPHLPEMFQKLSFHLYYQSVKLQIRITESSLEVSGTSFHGGIMIHYDNQTVQLSFSNPSALLHLNH